MIYTSLYHSPIGVIEISSDENCINSMMFRDAVKKPSPGNKPSDEIPQIIEVVQSQLSEYLNGKRKTFDIQLFQEGTSFQQAVWKELQRIPYGKTITYSELAQRMGNINKNRAVAAANAENKINIVVPCHRVIGQNNRLVGYGGDTWRKKYLLNLEYENSAKEGHLF